MSDEIQVNVLNYPDRKNLVLAYLDPVSRKRKTKSAGTANEREAERRAAKWEEELRNGGAVAPSKITWVQFREIYLRDKLLADGHSKETVSGYQSSLNLLGKILDPGRLASVNTPAMSRFVAKCKADGMSPSNLSRILRSIGAALRWAERNGYLQKVPKIDMPKLPSGYRGKGHAVIAEQHEKMLAACRAVRPDDWQDWQRFLSALWLSGLRLSESLALSWDKESGFRIDLSGKHPVYKIDGGAQKNRKTQTTPTTPDFAALLLSIPESERRGRVLKLRGHWTGQQLSPVQVQRIVATIARKAGVRVTAHDYRRAFGTRWAKRVMPPVLMKLMRHASINTTMRYYVDLDAQETADDLYRQFPAESNIPVTPDAATPEICGENGPVGALT